MSPAYDEGYKAFMDDKPRSVNPYCFCSGKSDLWDEGWVQAQADAKQETESDRNLP